MTQQKLYQKTRIFPSRISLIENGFAEPTAKERERLARALNVAVEEAFPPHLSSDAVAP